MHGSMCVHVCIYVCEYVCVCVCMCVCVCACVCVRLNTLRMCYKYTEFLAVTP